MADSLGDTGPDRPTVLLVDDDQGNLDLLREVLESGDVHVVATANDGPSGIELAARLDPDVILLDLRMPGMDGFETARLIRETGSPSQIVFLTAYEELLTKSAEEMGAYAYLVKGCSTELMLDVIRQAWRRGLQVRRGSES